MKPRRKRVGIIARIHELTSGEIIKMIGKKLYTMIKAKDPHPMFMIVEVAQEGESRGEMQMSDGSWENTVKWWSADIIKELAKHLKPVKDAFKRIWETHSDKSDIEADFNMPSGDVLGARTRLNADGKQVAEVVAYVQPGNVRDSIKNKRLDIASIEAFVDFVKEKGRWVAKEVHDVLGVALGNSDWERPGFESARVLSLIQEFEADDDPPFVDEDGNNDDPPTSRAGSRRRSSRRRMSMSDFTVAEVKVWIESQGVQPEAIFGAEKLVTFPFVKGAIDSAVQETIEKSKSTTDNVRKDTEKEIDDLKKNIKAGEDRIKTLETDLGGFRTEQNKKKLGEAIRNAEIMKDATEGEVGFVVDHISADVMDIEDVTERGKKLTESIDAAKKRMKDLGVTFNGKTDGDGDGDGGGDGDGKSKGKGVDPPGKGDKDKGPLNPITGEPMNPGTAGA